jgi:hypothetical protein
MRCSTYEQFRSRKIDPKKLHPLDFPKAVTTVPTYELAGFDSVAHYAEHHRRGVSTVFIGAAYDPSDRFPTPLGQKAGVVLHAYSVHSMQEGAKGSLWLGFVVDLIGGALAGIALARSWGDNYATSQRSTRVIRALRSLVVVVIASVVFLIVAGLASRCIAWINPGPMLFGLLIHSWYTSAKDRPRRAPGHRDYAAALLVCAAWFATVAWAIHTLLYTAPH